MFTMGSFLRAQLGGGFSSLQSTTNGSRPSYGNQLDSSKAGLGGGLEVGKEWWVSCNWGLGIALRFAGSSMKDQNDPTLIGSDGAGSVLFPATYN